MLRATILLIALASFFVAQASYYTSATVQLFGDGENHISQASAERQNPDNSGNPATNDEEESDAPSEFDDLKFLVSQVKVKFSFSQFRTFFENQQFSRWILYSNFERPPRLVS